MANSNDKRNETSLEVGQDEPDEWDKRIDKTGCAAENSRLTDCYYEKKDWRACAGEMKAFRECWQKHGNHERTVTEDVGK